MRVHLSDRAGLAALVLAHLLLTLAYSALTPLGEAPDEADHWAYVVFLAQERRLPIGPAMTQAKHPPLYHATAALIASLSRPSADFLRANPDVDVTRGRAAVAGQASANFFIHTALEDLPWRDGPLAFRLARLWSALLSSATVWAAFRLVRAAFVGRPAVAWATAGVLAFQPEFAFIGGALSNDNAAALLATLALWGGVALWRARQGGGPARDGGAGPAPLRRAGWWTSLALGLGLWAKVSTVAVWPAVALAAGMGAWSQARRNGAGTWRGLWETCRLLAAIFLPALLIAAPWFLRNWLLYGDPLGLALARQTVDVRAGPWTLADTAWLLRGWFLSFWGRFGGAGHLPMAPGVYALLGILTAVAGVGLVRAWLRPGWRAERPGLGLMALAAGATAAVIWLYSLEALGTDQGRLLFPAIAPLLALWTTGLLAWLPLPGADALAGRGATADEKLTQRHKGTKIYDFLGVFVALCETRAGIFRRDAWERSAVAALTAFSLGLGLYGLLGVIRPAFAPPPDAAAELRLEPSAAAPIVFGELTMVGWRLPVGGGPVLYWQATTQPTQDWRSVLRVTAADGALAWEWKRSPGAGRWSTDRWPPGYVMRDAYEIVWPAWAGPGRYRVEVGLFRFSGPAAVPMQLGQAIAGPDHPFVLLGWLEK